jgi:hypothetical protein
VRNGEEYVPNISHVFRQDQHLYLLYEIYAPTREKPAAGAPKGTKPGIDLLSSLELIQGSTKGLRDAAGAGEGDQRGRPRRCVDRTGCAAGHAEAGLLSMPVECD